MKSAHFYKTDRTYKTWEGMKSRCNNPLHPRYADYGGRGITVCKLWERDFNAFLADMGERPAGKTLDREDNDKGYNKENCHWASAEEQQRNTRRSVLTKDFVACIRYARESSELSSRKLAIALSKLLGIKAETIREVLKNRVWRSRE